ncbi:unnamed protein product [Rotaria sp. Silwood1]|nr:unnamed protein product [Rotaria sp. Silwood1]
MGNGALDKRAPSSHIQGIASTNVPAYSNHGTNSFRENYLYGVYTGVQWQEKILQVAYSQQQPHQEPQLPRQQSQQQEQEQ